MSNEYDYNKMLEDFESEERYLNRIKKIKNKWKSENKKYNERLEHMKEKKEEYYNNKRNNLLKEYEQKQKEIENQLFKSKVSKESLRKKQIEILTQKESQAKEKKILKLKRDEKERLEIQTQISLKSKFYIL